MKRKVVVNNCACRKQGKSSKRPGKDATDEEGRGKRAEMGWRRAKLSDIRNALGAALKPH